MATESPIRIMEASKKWPSCKDAASFGQSSANMTVEDLGLIFKGKFQGEGRNVVPNRCESAPPSMEGSFAAIENLMAQRESALYGFAHSKNSTDGYEPENHQRGNPAYFAYDSSYVSMNTRISLPLNSWENEHLFRRTGNLGSDWKVKSHGDTVKRSSLPSCGNLPTHNEEPEDDSSPRGAIGDQGPPKNGDALTHDDMACIQSPARNPSCMVSYESLEEAVDHDADMRQVSCSGPQNASVSSSSSVNSTGGTVSRASLYRRRLSSVNVHLDLDLSSSNVTDSDVAHIESGVKAIDIYGSSNTRGNSFKNQQHGSQNNMPHQQLGQQPNSTLQARGSQIEMTSRGVNYSYSAIPQYLHGPSTFSAADGQPILQSSGYTPPLYATAAALMTSPAPLYPNPQLPGYFHPQFIAGGYAVNPILHLPYLAGCSPHGVVPQALQGAASPSSAVSSGGSTLHAIDTQHVTKFYGQLGFAMQPSFTDPVHMQYFQQPFRDAYSFSGYFDSSSPRIGAAGSPFSSLDLRKGAEVATLVADQKVSLPGSAGHGVLNHPRRGSFSTHYHLGSPTNVGPLMQFPASSVASPVLPGSPIAGTSSGGGRIDTRFSSIVGRNTGLYTGWQGQGLDNSTPCSLLEELKSGKGRRFELSDIVGHVVEFSADQHGSRFIQQKLEKCSPEEKESVFKEIHPHAQKLMTDVFGNYVIQKFFEYGTIEQRKDLADQLQGQVLPLSFQMYGCRVIQKALEVIHLEQKVRLVQELDGHVMRCVRDQNGNHVVQKCIESIPTEKIQFIISSFHGQVAQLSTHPYGCRVIQRVLEHCTDQLQSQFIVDEILESVCALALDQYGNYVIQHLLGREKAHETSQIISKLSGRIVQLSQHKFASNVVEKCLEYGDSASRELLIEEIIGHGDGKDNLLVMMKDQYANYVVQKILHMCSDTQQEMLLSHIKDHLNALKKYTYGKHIVARFEQLYEEANEKLE